MNNIAVLHFGPIELYPPIQNLLSCLPVKSKEQRITVLTTGSNLKGLNKYETNDDHIFIKRFGHSGQKINVLKRYWCYFIFNTGALLYLILKRPKTIFYFETISSFPVYVYKRFLNANVRIFIHYHEYTSSGEYVSGMKLVRIFHKREKWLHPISYWLSHTNEFRMRQFVEDVKPVEIRNKRVLPNYPPKSWACLPQKRNGQPLKVVYVGALSIDTMFTKEFAEWVISQNGRVIWDVYSLNITEPAKTYLESLPASWIRLKQGVKYDELPVILKNYEVGVVLYKGHIPNYIYNAPNKLFEYLACGLDVWFPNVMTGSLPYVTDKQYPKVVAIDFSELNRINVSELVNTTGFSIKSNTFFCEDALKDLISEIIA